MVHSCREETRSAEDDTAGSTEYANSPPPPSVSPSSQTLPSSTHSIINFEGSQPFWEPDYPSQRFRPRGCEAKDFNERYPPPSQLFSPSVSPDLEKLQHTCPRGAPPIGPSARLKGMASSTDDRDEETTGSPFVPVYKGFTFTPRSNLTTYGAFANRSRLQDASMGGVYTLMTPTEGASSAARGPGAEDREIPPASNEMTRKVSKQTEGEDSQFSSETEIHSCGGVPVNAFDGDTPTMNEHQEKSFEELETERGIMEWNNTVFDERWLDPSPSIFEKPSHQQPNTPGMITGKQIEHASSKHQRWISLLRDLEETRKKMDLSARFKPDPSIWGIGDRTPAPGRVIHKEQSTQEVVGEQPWPGRLQEVVRDLEGGTGELPHGITHRPAVLRRYFYDRVFREDWQWSGADEQEMTKSGGRVGAVRDQTLQDIEDLISFMTAPAGHGVRKMTFPRTPEAAAMREEDPFGGNSADPQEEQFLRQYRRIGSDADFTSFRGFERRNTMVEKIDDRSASGPGAVLNKSMQPQRSTSIAVAQHVLNQKDNLVENGRGMGEDFAQKHGFERSRGQNPGSKGFLKSRARNPSPLRNEVSQQIVEDKRRGASGSEGGSLSEESPVRHDDKADIARTASDASLLRKRQLDLLRAAGRTRSLSQENQSSSQATLTAESEDVTEPNRYHLMDDVGAFDTKFADHTQHHGLRPRFHGVQTTPQDERLPIDDVIHAQMFKESDWENYPPPLSVMDPTKGQSPPNMAMGPSPSAVRPGYGNQQSTMASFDTEQSAYNPHRSWEEGYDSQPTTVSQQPSRSVTQQTLHPGTQQTTYGSPPSAHLHSMQYSAQPMQYGFPHQAVGYAGSSRTNTGSSTAYDAAPSRHIYGDQGVMGQSLHSWNPDWSQSQSYNHVGVRPPAPNRFAAILARSKEFENYGIAQASESSRQQQSRGMPGPSQNFSQHQPAGYPVAGEGFVQNQLGGISFPPQATGYNPMRGPSVPPQSFVPNRVRGTPAPNIVYNANHLGQASTPSQVLPAYPGPGAPTPFQSVPESYARSTRTPTQALQSSYEWQSRFGIPQDMVKPDLPILQYRDGSDDMRPHSTQGVPTVAYQNLVRNLGPNCEALMTPENLPFTETGRVAKPVEWGVLKIGNIPYDISKDLVVSFLGNHAKLITANLGPAIHIIMDRVTGKTMDCFVEFLSPLDARATCNSINLRQRGLVRISDRVVDVNMSTQNELLATLFPKAKDVKWVNGKPIVMQPEEEWSSGFKSFVSPEELGLLVKHAEQPHRSNYTQRSPQRCYESMISLLAKFPWHSVENYTLHHRNLIFNAARQMLHILSINIRKQYGQNNHSRGGSNLSYATSVSHGSSERYSAVDKYSSAAYGGIANINPGSKSAEALTEELMKDLLSACLNAAGFSERQRWQLYESCEYAKHHFVVSPILQHWPFEVLGRKMRVEEDVIEFYAQIIAYNPEVEQTGTSFGSLHKITARLDMESQTMDKYGSMELKMLEALLIGGIQNASTQLPVNRDMAALAL